MRCGPKGRVATTSANLPDGGRWPATGEPCFARRWHQLVTLKRTFNWLADGGLYIIEDMETSYWDGRPPLIHPALYGYAVQDAGTGRRGSSVEKLKQVADVLNRKFLSDPTFTYLEGVDHDFAAITFVTNAVVITKTFEHLSGNRSAQRPQRWPDPRGKGWGYRLCPVSRENPTCGLARDADRVFDPEQQSLLAAQTANSWAVAGTPPSLEQIWPGGWREPA